MSIAAVKFTNLNDRRKQSAQKIASLLSQLNAESLVALKQQAYIKKNPDNNIDPDFSATITANISSIVTSYNSVKSKLDDLVSVMSDTMTADDMIAKHSIDLVQVSEELL